MKDKTIPQNKSRKLTPSRILKNLTEALMVKTGIKAGPEFTGGH